MNYFISITNSKVTVIYCVQLTSVLAEHIEALFLFFFWVDENIWNQHSTVFYVSVKTNIFKGIFICLEELSSTRICCITLNAVIL